MKTFLGIILFTFSLQGFSQNWNYDFAKAKELAQAENKNIIMVFSGSDWCGPCMLLEKNIWRSTEFQNEASNSWILVRVDFPRKKANQLSKEQTEGNRALAEKYNRDGSFPLVILMQGDGKILGKLGYKNVGPDEYIQMIHNLEKS